MEKTDTQESTAVTFEWTLRGLKNIFESSKGESKSKVTKSLRFGNGRWQILFYANSGTEGGGFVSLYLSCEPTAEEKDNAVDGRWVREGVYKFNFELRSLGKTALFNIKEAHNHSFSSKTANWGWAQFARRDHVYYHSNAVKDQDAFLIICTITSSPAVPVQPPTAPAQLVPKDFLERVGSLLDDPLYSDVEFVLPSRGRSKGSRFIYANRKILQRADYFQTSKVTGSVQCIILTLGLSLVFSSGFCEASSDHGQYDIDDGDGASDDTYLSRQYDDSDDEDEDFMIQTTDEPSFDGTIESQIEEDAGPSVPVAGISSTDLNVQSVEEDAQMSGGLEDEQTRNVQPKLSHPSSPRSNDVALDTNVHNWMKPTAPAKGKEEVVGPKKMRVFIRDVAYATYRAVLYYIYTDVIVFAPISSSFHSTAQKKSPTIVSTAQAPSDSQSNLLDVPKAGSSMEIPTSRREWIRRWQQNHPGRPSPCSAKAAYRLADKLGLLDLKERAYQHIQKSLTVDNIPYEVFSPFSATFSDVRKVQVNFFLEHWGDIRSSDAMRSVWQQIRIGRHPGFEEVFTTWEVTYHQVWPLIAQHLVFNPKTGGTGDTEPIEG
ncbi:uncharacterized protein EDB93DRAFT_1335600 [Suillus bovinus]|uniref:uncharacterized protein n=1 Tax=Suillus bovinus TaxID=48563 RepID=UPI001B8741EB|nr:uncharacterized protein EDB93DRAFT_1335600 [Suillus bovinus]KAG2155894.1 hypothetical protein EDB93DRAFT_1335600 [Suillus bovinus]